MNARRLESQAGSIHLAPRVLIGSVMQTIETAALAAVSGGAADQVQLRQLAQQYCPSTFSKFKAAGKITRPMAETCLDEAHMGFAKGRLDQYFPPKQ